MADTVTKEEVSKLIHDNMHMVPDWPKEKVNFLNILRSVSMQPEIAKAVISCLEDRYKEQEISAVAGIEARGFVFGSQLAYALHLPFIPLRKAGKTPPPVDTVSYDLEYGSATLELERGIVTKGQKVIIVDDVLATGGTAEAACKLIEQTGAEVIELAIVVELPFLNGRTKVEPHKLFSITTFDE